MNSDIEVSNTSDGAARSTLPQWTGQVEAMSQVDGATMAITTGDNTVTDYADEPRRQVGYDILHKGLVDGKLGMPFYPWSATTTSAAPQPRRAMAAAWSTTAATSARSGTASTATAGTSSSSRTTTTPAA